MMYNLGNTTGRHCDLSEKRIYLILCAYDKSHPTVNTSLIGFGHLLAFEYSSCSSSTPEEGVQMQICCSARAGTPSAATSSQVHTYPRGQHWHFPTFIPSGRWFLFPNIFQVSFFLISFNCHPFPWGHRALHCAWPCSLCLGSPGCLLTAGWKWQRPPEAPEPSCYRAVTSEAVSPAGGLACRSRERFQLWHFKPPRCAGAHLSLPGVTWRN